MRTIKFRGKSVHTGIWHYGDLLQQSYNVCLIQERGTAGFLTEPETVGQFTGFTDCVTREIYDRDILHFEEYGKNYTALVKWNEEIGAWCMQLNYEPRLGSRPLGEWLKEYRLEVFGNIYDNPELLKGGAV